MENRKIVVQVHSDGRITTVNGWYIGRLADIVDYDQLEREEKELAELEAENAKLQAVVDAAKKAVSQHGVVYPIPSSGAWAMTELEQAVKEVGDE